MDEIALKAYKAKLSTKEECYKMHKKTFNDNITKYKRCIIFDIILIVVIDFTFRHAYKNLMADRFSIMLWSTIVIPIIALIINSINYYRYTHMRQAIKIGPFTISGRNNLLAILKEDERQISTLKNQIAFIERERELQAKESNK